MADRDYKAFIVEGEAREPQIINNISKVFYSKSNIKIITLPAGQNIYMLWKTLMKDDFDTDIIEVLREEHEELNKQLEGLKRDDFSEVYLFFDYDGHQDNLKEENSENVLEQMLLSFDNETDNGKLYISYPMVEALRDFEEGICGRDGQCFVPIEQMRYYKNISAERSIYSQFNHYDIVIWKALIDVFTMKVSCLLNRDEILTYDEYVDSVDPIHVYKQEIINVHEQGIFVLSAFPEFLIDYFGIKLWKTSVKHTGDLQIQENCQGRLSKDVLNG